ncbi:hypothetical protein GQX74_015709 [Glossina fuscipes]|nr:hypothetical protein GQX74_015709 [Glossina fuscipes]
MSCFNGNEVARTTGLNLLRSNVSLELGISSYFPGREKLWTLRGYFELTASVCYCSARVRVEATINYTTRELSAFEMRGNCGDLRMYLCELVHTFLIPEIQYCDEVVPVSIASMSNRLACVVCTQCWALGSSYVHSS